MKINKENGMKIYNEAIKFLKNSWPGYVQTQGCLYDSEGFAVLFKIDGSFSHLDLDNINLYGSTISVIDGVKTAIVDITNLESLDEIIGTFIHELFHVHQMNNWTNISFPNPEYLITYPIELYNENYRFYENDILVKMFTNKDTDLNKFLQVRCERKKLLEEKFNKYECSIETIEGCAFFLERDYLHQKLGINIFNDKLLNDLYIKKLSSDSIRRQYYVKGALIANTLNRIVPDWKNKVELNQQTLDDILNTYVKKDKLKECNLEINKTVKRLVVEKQENNIKCLNKFIGDSFVKIEFESTPQVRCIDPNNLDSLSSTTILHKNMLHLGNGDNYIMISGKEVLSTFSDSIWLIESLIIKNININFNEGEQINYKDDNLQINWLVKKVQMNSTGHLTITLS